MARGWAPHITHHLREADAAEPLLRFWRRPWTERDQLLVATACDDGAVPSLGGGPVLCARPGTTSSSAHAGGGFPSLYRQGPGPRICVPAAAAPSLAEKQ